MRDFESRGGPWHLLVFTTKRRMGDVKDWKERKDVMEGRECKEGKKYRTPKQADLTKPARSMESAP